MLPNDFVINNFIGELLNTNQPFKYLGAENLGNSCCGRAVRTTVPDEKFWGRAMQVYENFIDNCSN